MAEGDSPLSTTANIISLLTLAYAIVITLLYRGKQLASANDEMTLFLQRASSELDAFLATRDRLLRHLAVFAQELGWELAPLLTGTQDAVESFEMQFSSLRALGGRKPGIFEGSRFLYTREDLVRTVGELGRVRGDLEGVYRGLVNRTMFDEIHRQNSVLAVQHQTLLAQNNMLQRIMTSLNLDPEAETPDLETSEKSILEKDLAFSSSPPAPDMLEMYLRSTNLNETNPRKDYLFAIEGSRGNRQLVLKGPSHVTTSPPGRTVVL